ncbi:MAG: cbb3-type cytochrome oxidase assembly protein CcoS [Bacteroidota bacterium]
MNIIKSCQIQSCFYQLNTLPMSVIVILLIASIAVAALFLAGFIWSVKTGQYDDEISPAMRILFEEKPEKQLEEKPVKPLLAKDIPINQIKS